MAMIVLGVVKDRHAARGVVRALDDAGFGGDDIDVSSGLLDALAARGVPEEHAHQLAEAVRRGATLVSARAEDEDEATEAAQVMVEHGAIDIDACVVRWKSEGWRGRVELEPVPDVERYAALFGEYPAGRGRIYRDLRIERRLSKRPYAGINRRAA
jgi:hypothetical protein